MDGFPYSLDRLMTISSSTKDYSQILALQINSFSREIKSFVKSEFAVEGKFFSEVGQGKPFSVEDNIFFGDFDTETLAYNKKNSD